MRKITRTASFVGKTALGLLFVSPLFVGLVFSFLPNEILFKVPSVEEIFQNLSLDNYVWVLNYIPILRYLLNSFIVCGIVILVQVVLDCLAGYAFACFEFPGKKFLFSAILVAMMIPGEVTVIANFLQIQKWGLLNTYLGLSITSFVGGTGIFMMRQFFLQLPHSIKDAARVDGCGELRFLAFIAAPMASSAIASLAIYLFIAVYNMYFWPMLVGQKTEMQTIQIGMSMLVGIENKEYGHVLAGAVISILVPVIIFIFGQDFIIRGMTEGAEKG